MQNTPNILVVCSKNKKRSRTAESIYKNDSRFNIRSVGLSPKSPRKINDKDITWADSILVMMPEHRSRIKQKYMNIDLPEIIVLEIQDIYDYMNPELIELLEEKIEDYLKSEFGL
jgi:predicted protein tyrosine phosphatase